MPISRYTMNRIDDIEAAGLMCLPMVSIAVLVWSVIQKVVIYLCLITLNMTPQLADEYQGYRRGPGYGPAAKLFPNDDPTQSPVNNWRPFAFLLISNWINDLYQSTPFDLTEIEAGDGVICRSELISRLVWPILRPVLAGFPIKMKMRPGLSRQFFKAGILTKQIVHLPLPVTVGAASNGCNKTPGQLGELTGCTTFDGPMKGIMWARGNFIE